MCTGNGTLTEVLVLSRLVARGAYSPARTVNQGIRDAQDASDVFASLPAARLRCAGPEQQRVSPRATAMHFDAKDMDTSGDGMITKEEMMAYAAKMWDMMAMGKDTIRISRATKDFATGGLAFNARAMDTDHDGSISKQEFLTYAEHKFDKNGAS